MNTFRMQVFSENGQAKSGISQRHRKELSAFNQNDNENEKDMIYEMNKKNDHKQDGLNVRNILISLILGIVICALLTLCTSCTTTKYVPVTETRTEHHWHTDSVRERDSTHTERKTIIRELDSAAMARYGIQMQANQRAWLVLQREMENRLRELEHMTANRDTVRDSIPVPYPVEVVKDVEKPLTWWQQTKMHVGAIVIFGLLIALFINIIIRIFKKYFLP